MDPAAPSPDAAHPHSGGRVSTSNRLALDYRKVAAAMPAPCPIIDIHTHVQGARAAPIWREAAVAFGISRVFTQVRIDEAATVREALGDMVRFIAFPNFRHEDRWHAFTEGYLRDIEAFRTNFDARVLKIWNAPRMHDFFEGARGQELIPFDSPWRTRQLELGQRLGMMFMVHVADPDTWFATKYKDASKYRAKLDHYSSLRRVMDRFEGPWIAAHMGGWPEDLRFLDDLLAKHPNLTLDTSATKWIVREISRHPRDESADFFTRHRHRILFGSDIVTTEEHLAPKPVPSQHPMADLADSPESAFDLYASRYFALRTMLEGSGDRPSNIADPDLMMVDPARFGPMDAPTLRGLALPDDVLQDLYHRNARRILARVGVAL